MSAAASGRQQFVIEPTRGWRALKLGELWAYRDLFWLLAWRDVRVRYRQTVLGVGWAVLQPLVTILVFSLIFGRLAKVPSDGAPYPAFTFSALLPWTLFSTALTRAASSLIANAALLTKVYFPRVLIPLACVIHALVDVAVSMVLLVGIMLLFGVTPAPTMLLFPFFVLLAIAGALGVSLWLAALNVRYRDVKHLLPFLLQVWMYATPVVYPSTLIPARFRALYAVNPMAGVVEGFRWSLTGHGAAPGQMLLVSGLVILVILGTGLIFFRRTERTFADII